MRYKYFSILYLAVILFYLLRPLLPYFEYVINRNFIIENLCVEKDNSENTCNGKCYLHEQLNKANSQEDHTKDDKGNRAPENRLDDHLKVSSAKMLIFPDVSSITRYFYLHQTTSFVSRIFVPPQK